MKSCFLKRLLIQIKLSLIISLAKLTKEQSEECEGEITKNEVKDALGNMI